MRSERRAQRRLPAFERRLVAHTADPPDRHSVALDTGMRVPACEVIGRADHSIRDVHRQLHLADELCVDDVAELMRLDLACGLSVVVNLVEHDDAWL